MRKVTISFIILSWVLMAMMMIFLNPTGADIQVATASSNQFDSSPAWPLCGRIEENPPTGWQKGDDCPSNRWGSDDHSDYPLSSSFGPRQLVSGNYRYDFHRGIDIATPISTSVFAIADGVVRKAGNVTGYSDPMVQLRHYRPGYSGCKSGDGCYHSLYLHLSDWVVSQGQSVSKGDLIGYTGASHSGFAHLHFELRNAVAADPYSSWQRDAIHPLSVLPYTDSITNTIAITINEVSQVGTKIKVTSTFTIPMEALDLKRVQAYVYKVEADNSLTLVEQAGDTANANGYNVHPSWFDVEDWNRQYTHKNSSKFPWSSFNTCPYASDHPSSYDPNVHMDQQDPNNYKVGSFNGVKMAPEHYNANSEAAVVSYTFNELTSTVSLNDTCLVVKAKDVKDMEVSAEYNCP